MSSSTYISKKEQNSTSFFLTDIQTDSHKLMSLQSIAIRVILEHRTLEIKSAWHYRRVPDISSSHDRLEDPWPSTSTHVFECRFNDP
jgi:hypothetical protein